CGRVYGQHAGKTKMSVRTSYYRAGIGALGYPATAGSTSSTDIVDYGNTQCDSYFPDPGCPSASPSPSGTDNWLPQESRTSVIPVQKPLAYRPLSQRRTAQPRTLRSLRRSTSHVISRFGAW